MNPQFAIVFKQHGALKIEQRLFGPFAEYLDAEDALGDGRVPLLYGQGGCAWPGPVGSLERPEADGYRYIQQLELPSRG